MFVARHRVSLRRTLAAVAALALAMTSLAAPPNDDCANAIDIALGTTSFSNVQAGTDGPAFPCAPAAPQAGARRDVWFRFTPAYSGPTRISACGSPGINTIIAIYQGCGCGGLLPAKPIACNDNACGDDARIDVTLAAGQCYLIRIAGVGTGPDSSGLGTLTVQTLNPELAINAEVVLSGENAGDRFGQSVAFAGDFKNDGIDDVIVGAHLNDQQAGNAGRALVRMGGSFAAVSGFVGENAGDNFGRIVAGGCDFDGDGYDDILIGAPLNDDNGADAGKAYCFSGFNETLLWVVRGQLPGDQLGTAIDCVGDVNGDGVEDVLIGAPRNDISGTNAGRAYVVAGQDGSVIEIFSGIAAGEQFGAAVTGLGDVNADTVSDFAIAAPRSKQAGPNAGRVVIYSGATLGTLQIIKGDPGERFGASIAGMTVQTGAQRRTYLAVGAPDNPSAGALAGRVRLFTRLHSAPQCPRWLCEAWSVDGERLGDRFGSAVALGNVLGGAAPEVLVGAPGGDVNGTDCGATYVLSTSDAATRRRIVGDSAGDSLGTSLSAAGDIDTDGLQDFVLGAPLNDAAGNNAGRAYVFLSGGQSQRVPGSVGEGGELAGREVSGMHAELAAIFRDWGACLFADCGGDLNADGQVDARDIAAAILTN